MIKPFKSALISILILFCTAAILYAEGIPGLNVSYDQKEDLLTVDAKGVPLTRILAQIAEQSGIEIMIDPSVEKEITLYLPAQPLEKALKQLARGLNYAMHYDKSDSRLVAIKIVPQGKQTSGKLVSVTGSSGRMSHPVGIYDSHNEDDAGNYTERHTPEIKNKQKLPAIVRKKMLNSGER